MYGVKSLPNYNKQLLDMNNQQDFFRIGSTKISVTNPKETINKITDAVVTGKSGYICVSNMLAGRKNVGIEEYRVH